MRSKPRLPGALGWYWQRYFEIDRTDWGGRPTFEGMCRVLDEYDIRDPGEREAIRGVWFAMASVEGEVRESQRKAEEKEAERKAAAPDHSVHPAMRRRKR
jgi:hypothetical protein